MKVVKSRNLKKSYAKALRRPSSSIGAVTAVPHTTPGIGMVKFTTRYTATSAHLPYKMVTTTLVDNMMTLSFVTQLHRQFFAYADASSILHCTAGRPYTLL